MLEVEQKYEAVRKEYAAKEAIGIPMSVRELCKRRLSKLRKKLEEAGRSDVVQCNALTEQAVRNQTKN